MPKPYKCVKKITFLLCFGFATYSGWVCCSNESVNNFWRIERSASNLVQRWTTDPFRVRMDHKT